MVKIVIPVADENGDTVSAHFGRVPYYAVYNVVDGKTVEKRISPNDSSHFGGQGLPPERIMALGADIVISAGMGQRAISMFQESAVAVLQAQDASVEKSIQDYVNGKLTELTEGCLHDHEDAHER